MKISARDQGDQAKAYFTNLKRELKERFGCSSVYRWSPNFVTFVCQGREENVKSAIKFLQQQSQVGIDVCITDLFPYLNVMYRGCAKEAVHLTCSPNRGVGAPSSVSASNPERAPTFVYIHSSKCACVRALPAHLHVMY